MASEADAATPVRAPVFVLAAPGVPAQTLAAALGRGPGGLDLPEINLGLAAVLDSALLEMTGLRQTQMHGLLRALAHLLAGEQTAAAVDMAQRWLGRRAHLGTPAVWREVVALAAPLGVVAPAGPLLFDPSARARLIEAFPEARLIHLRAAPEAYARIAEAGPAAAAALLLGAGVEGEPDPARLLAMTEEGVASLAALAAPGALLEVDLAAFAARPRSILREAAAWLGGPGDEDALDAMLVPEDSPFAGPGPYGAHMAGDVIELAVLDEMMALVGAGGDPEVATAA